MEITTNGSNISFLDATKRECTMYLSSFPDDDTLSFGHLHDKRMYLTKDQLKELLPILHRFAYTGELRLKSLADIEKPFAHSQLPQLRAAIKALDAYLNAGNKEARTAASVLAKDVWEKYHGKSYHNQNEGIQEESIEDEGALGLYDAVAQHRKDYPQDTNSYIIDKTCGNCASSNKITIPKGIRVEVFLSNNEICCSNCEIKISASPVSK